MIATAKTACEFHRHPSGKTLLLQHRVRWDYLHEVVYDCPERGYRKSRNFTGADGARAFWQEMRGRYRAAGCERVGV